MIQSCLFYIKDAFKVVSNQLLKQEQGLKNEVIIWKLDSCITDMRIAHTFVDKQVRATANRKLHTSTLRHLRVREHKQILVDAFAELGNIFTASEIIECQMREAVKHGEFPEI